jgi:hypothetical protein
VADVALMGLIVQTALILSLGVTPATGYAVRYSPGVMERVADNRGIPHQPCMVAWTAAQDSDIGERWLTVAGPGGAARCLVVDLPHPRDRGALERRGILVELGYHSRWICGPGWSGRARDCPVRVR